MVLTSEELKIRTDLYHRETTIRNAVCKTITFVDTAVQTCTCIIYHSRGGSVVAKVAYAKSSRDKGREEAKKAALQKLRREF